MATLKYAFWTASDVSHGAAAAEGNDSVIERAEVAVAESAPMGDGNFKLSRWAA